MFYHNTVENCQCFIYKVHNYYYIKAEEEIWTSKIKQIVNLHIQNIKKNTLNLNVKRKED